MESLNQYEFTPQESKINDYTSDYKNRIKSLLKYLSETEEKSEKSNSYIDDINYKLNNIEISLLYLVKYSIYHYHEWISEPKNYTFLLSEVFFICYCRDQLKIPFDEEFTQSLSQKIINIFRNLLKKSNPELYNELFQSNNIKSSFFRKYTEKAGYEIIEKASSSVSIFFKILEFKDIIKSFFDIINPLLIDNQYLEKMEILISYRLTKKLKFEEKFVSLLEKEFSEMKSINEEYNDLTLNNQIKITEALLGNEKLTNDERVKIARQHKKLKIEEREAKMHKKLIQKINNSQFFPKTVDDTQDTANELSFISKSEKTSNNQNDIDAKRELFKKRSESIKEFQILARQNPS